MANTVHEVVELSGHIIDSWTLPRAWDIIMDRGGNFDVEEMRVGRHKTESSYVRLKILAPNSEVLDLILTELQQMDQITLEFAKTMAELNMFTPLQMRVRDGDREKNIAGCWVVNEERLNNLSSDKFLELRAKRYLPAIYAQLMSLAQIERLMKLKEKRPATLKAA